MRSCATCRHCVCSISLKRSSYKSKFKEKWANLRITTGRVRCKKGMWLKANGEERTYKDLASLIRQNKNWGRIKGSGCFNYES